MMHAQQAAAHSSTEPEQLTKLDERANAEPHGRVQTQPNLLGD